MSRRQSGVQGTDLCFQEQEQIIHKCKSGAAYVQKDRYDLIRFKLANLLQYQFHFFMQKALTWGRYTTAVWSMLRTS